MQDPVDCTTVSEKPREGRKNHQRFLNEIDNYIGNKAINTL